MELGYFIVDQKNCVVSINDVALKYAIRKKGIIEWHGEGTLKV